MRLDLTYRPLIMGIVNVTPDSFSGDGVMQIETAVKQALQMLDDGAAILDIGGESSRPGAAPVSADEEIRRVVPVIEGIRKARAGEFAIAIDTVKAVVAEAALNSGANIINDISALGDAAMAGVAAKHKCPIIVMHNRASDAHHDKKIGGTYNAAEYTHIVDDVKRDLMKRVEIARAAGLADENIILDPGIGFGKSVEQNLALIRNIPELKKFGFPILIGASRKSFIGKILDAPVGERLEGDAAITAIATYLGADILRVHDVKFMARVAKVTTAISLL